MLIKFSFTFLSIKTPDNMKLSKACHLGNGFVYLTFNYFFVKLFPINKSMETESPSGCFTNIHFFKWYQLFFNEAKLLIPYVEYIFI